MIYVAYVLSKKIIGLTNMYPSLLINYYNYKLDYIAFKNGWFMERELQWDCYWK